MPIEREYHDPTSPECLVAKQNLELMEKQKKSIELANITNLIHLVGVLLEVVFMAIITMAVMAIATKG